MASPGHASIFRVAGRHAMGINAHPVCKKGCRMDWDDLRLFLAIARQGTITDAARTLGYDHSTLSRRLSQLEAAIGIELFHRAGRRLRITDAGSRLQRTAEKMETALIRDMAEIDAARAVRGGSVTVGVPEGLGVGYLAGRIGEIVAAYPEISIELIALPRNFSLADREADIAITLDRPTAGDLTFRKLTDYTLQFYGSPAYFTVNAVPRSAQDLQDHRLCGYIDQLLHTDELDYMRALGRNLRAQLKSSSIAAQLQTVLSGAALASEASAVAMALARRAELTADLTDMGILRLELQSCPWSRTQSLYAGRRPAVTAPGNFLNASRRSRLGHRSGRRGGALPGSWQQGARPYATDPGGRRQHVVLGEAQPQRGHHRPDAEQQQAEDRPCGVRPAV
ncbi:MAG: LysR family transcriptional regulator, partial [Rhizobiales bacterium]|nr:LysR family transcriptional regulator [Hyphomicrobiales bacterium]